MEVRLRRWLPVLLVVLALAGAGWAAAGGTGLSGGELSPPAEDPPPPQPPDATTTPAGPVPETGRPDEPTPGIEMPGWLSGLMTALVLAMTAGVIGLFLYVGARWLLTERVIRREITDQPASQPPGAQAEQVRAALRAGLADLDAGGDARRAVIACWLRLERVAAAAGTARMAADTPADLVARLLSAHRVSDRALARLADAYRLARYAPVEIAEELPAIAGQALREIDDQLAAGIRGRPDPEPAIA
jgi:hypothetical protein